MRIRAPKPCIGRNRNMVQRLKYSEDERIIKYPFWNMTAQNPDATYVCVNYSKVDSRGSILSAHVPDHMI